jgi:hypothetical protein
MLVQLRPKGITGYTAKVRRRSRNSWVMRGARLPSAAEGLLAQLRKSLDEPEADDTDAERTARFRRKIKALIDRGLWAAGDNPLTALDAAAGGEVRLIKSVAPASTRRQWEWVIELARESGRFDVADLQQRTVVGLLNTYLPSAFTVPTAGERLIVVDNAFHDFIYGACKYLVLASDPVDPGDPIWRTARAGQPGRFYAVARLLRLVLATIRWNGFVYFPVDALLPPQLTMLAADEYTEPAQLFILAHEAGHILSGHLDRGRLAPLAVGPTTVAAVDCEHETEHEADLIAARLLAREAERSGLAHLSTRMHALQAAHILFSLLFLFTDSYFIRPPSSHPDPQARLDRLTTAFLDGEPEEQVLDAVTRRPSFRNLPLLVGLTRGDYRDDVPFSEFWAEVIASKFCFERATPEDLPQLRTCEELEDLLTQDPADSLRRVAAHIVPDGTVQSVPPEITAMVTQALRELAGNTVLPDDLVAEVVRLELARIAICEREISPWLDKIHAAVLEPAPGTPFHRWVDGLRLLLPAPLVLPCTHLGYIAARQGAEVLRQLPRPVSDAFTAWAITALRAIP